ncbi:hypothetical protein QBC36DRAFT_330871 [Triangularia setosa]|uniref:Secreted protein n=1 Tax=Triangularia setosa TaxID=2587417 RepID=A0AAN6W671_9PEZI|nr:hypothetical protein QBC36DRAFT_330871 [Podospora setosa]
MLKGCCWGVLCGGGLVVLIPPPGLVGLVRDNSLSSLGRSCSIAGSWCSSSEVLFMLEETLKCLLSCKFLECKKATTTEMSECVTGAYLL